jgi:Holliday junction resolvase RusA-like endonuclease
MTWTVAALRAKGYHLPEDSSLAQTTRMTLTLPWPPSLNKLYMPTPAGKRLILTPAGKCYKREAVWRAREQARGHAPLTGRLSMWTILHPPTHAPKQGKYRPNVDNYSKLVCDCLGEEGAHIYDDDEQFDDMRVTRGTACDPAYLAITIQSLRHANLQED